MSDDDFDLDFDDEEEYEDFSSNIKVKKMANQKKRFLKEQIELREIAKELGLSVADYLEAFGDTGSMPLD